jgi:hypothetical protein
MARNCERQVSLKFCEAVASAASHRAVSVSISR